MYQRPSRRKQLIQRISIYAGMSIAVIVLVVALLFVVLGYQLNRTDGRFEQGGLVQFDSKPSGADVTIDGVGLGFRTATKSTLNAGDHFFSISKNGYKTWQKSVNLAPGAVVWLNYARLIPSDIKTENVLNFSHISSSVASPDERWIGVQEDPATPLIRLVDISRREVKTKDIALPQTLYTAPEPGKSQNFSLETWDPSSRYILVKHTFNDTAVEWLIVDTQDPSRTKNITVLLNVAMSKVVFNNGDSNILYVQTDRDVRRVDVNAGTISRPLVGNVAEFSLFDRSTIVFSSYIDPITKARQVGYYEDGADKPHTIRTYTDDGQASLHVALGKYFSEPYVAISYGETLEILRGDLPKDVGDVAKMAKETSLHITGGAQYVAIRTNGRFVVAQQGAEYYVYDNELKHQSKTTLKGQAPITKQLSWLDNYMVWSDRDGMLRFYEFDGANQNDIMPVMSGQMVTLSADDTYVYAMTASQNGQHLTRARLILP
jgi:hypothetical protein